MDKKNDHDNKISDINGKIPSITALATTAAFNAQINEVRNKIPSITGLATSALTAVENKILNAGELARKSDYDNKIRD